MKIEFTQQHTEQLSLDDLTPEQFLSLALETSRQSGWIDANVIKTGFVAYTNNGMFAWNAEIKMKISDKFATIQSQCRGNGYVDVVENKKNIQGFILKFKALKKALISEKPELKNRIIKSNLTYAEYQTL
jgi:rhomboid protease GluP